MTKVGDNPTAKDAVNKVNILFADTITLTSLTAKYQLVK